MSISLLSYRGFKLATSVISVRTTTSVDMNRPTKKHRENRSQPNLTSIISPSNEESQSSVSYEEVRDWSLLVAQVIREVSEASEMLSPLKATMGLIIKGLEITRSLNENSGAWKEFQDALDVQAELIKGWQEDMERQNRPADAAATKALCSYDEALASLKDELKRYIERPKSGIRNFFTRVSAVKREQDAVRDLNARMGRAFDRFSSTMSTVISRQISEFQAENTRMHAELRLEVRSGQSRPHIQYGTIESIIPLISGKELPRCEEGTRIEILQDIRKWANEDSSGKPIYWLADLAGSGKTTIAATMAHSWVQEKRLAARFFFSPNSSTTVVTDQLCTLVAKEMALQIPSLEPIISVATRVTPTTHFGFQEQLRRLILEPLQTLQLNLPFILVIDAIDSCHADERIILLDGILAELSSFPQLRLFITSRPLLEIDQILSTSVLVQRNSISLIDMNDKVHRDIRLFIEKKLPRLTADQRNTIIGQSSGLFLFAYTAYRILRRSRNPGLLIAQLFGEEMSGELNKLYLGALKQAESDPSSRESMKSVLAFVTAAFQPISSTTLEAFLPHVPSVYDFVQDLGGVLKDGDPEKPVFVIHSTFREFLTDTARSNGFSINPSTSHQSFAEACMMALRKLDYDILHSRIPGQLIPRNVNLSDLRTKIDSYVPASTLYAASYWLNHVTVYSDNTDLWHKAIAFLVDKFVPWLEIMSWRNELGSVLNSLKHMLKKAESISIRNELTDMEVMNLIRAHQYVVRFQRLISESALHSYTLLAYSPDDSPLLSAARQRYSKQMPKVISSAPISWQAGKNLPNKENLLQLMLSPDGTRIIGLADSLQLWDVSSSALIADVKRISSFTVSLQGNKAIYSTFPKHQFYIMDLNTGQSKQCSPPNLARRVEELAIIPDRPYFAISTRNASEGIRIWDAERQEFVGSAMMQEDPVLFMVASPDGSRLVCACKKLSGSDPVSIILWDLHTFEEVNRSSVPSLGTRQCIKFTEDGRHYLVFDWRMPESSLYIRDSQTGSLIQQFKGHSMVIRDAHFSPNGDYIVSYSNYDFSAILWSIQEAHGQTLRHEGGVHLASFSADSKRLATVSTDQTVRVWDAASGASLRTFFIGYTGSCSLAAIAANWSVFSILRRNKQIEIYDITTPAEGLSIAEDASAVWEPQVAFSIENELAVCKVDPDVRSLQIWDLKTASPRGDPLKGLYTESGIINVVGISFDSSVVASGSYKGLVQIWESSEDGWQWKMLGRHKEKVTSLTFSQDSHLLASISSNLIQVWDLSSSTSIWSTELGPRDAVSDIAFSHDSTEVAAFRRGKGLFIWNLRGGERSVESRYKHAEHIAFDSKRTMVATAHECTFIAVWNVRNTAEEMMRFVLPSDIRFGSTWNGAHLGFSSDGVYVVFGSFIFDVSIPGQVTQLDPSKPCPTTLKDEYTNSLLTCIDGWIYSAFPRGRLMPLPEYLHDRPWGAVGNKICIFERCNSLIVIDCDLLLTSTA